MANIKKADSKKLNSGMMKYYFAGISKSLIYCELYVIFNNIVIFFAL